MLTNQHLYAAIRDVELSTSRILYLINSKGAKIMVDRFERFSLAISEISKYWHLLAAEEMEKYSLKAPTPYIS